jgi:hypothetical protein
VLSACSENIAYDMESVEINARGSIFAAHTLVHAILHSHQTVLARAINLGWWSRTNLPRRRAGPC